MNACTYVFYFICMIDHLLEFYFTIMDQTYIVSLRKTDSLFAGKGGAQSGNIRGKKNRNNSYAARRS